MITPKLGERVLVVPQAHGHLMNPHLHTVNVFGQSPYVVGCCGSRAVDAAPPSGNWPCWEVFTSTLVRKGYGVLVVRDGKLEEGPSDWDTGD